MPGNEVTCPGGWLLLLEDGSKPEAVLVAGMTAEAGGAGVWVDMRWSSTFLM